MKKITQYQKAQKLLNLIRDDTNFTSKEVISLYTETYGDIKEKSMSWILYQLVKDKEIIRMGRNKYRKATMTVHRNFNYEYSSHIEKLIEKISSEYREINLQIWELKILNEFLNHQLTTNLVFVEVEKGFEEFVFESIKEIKKVNTFMHPDIKTFNQVISDDMIIVLNLISETISNKEDSQKISIEKLIVDLFANKYISEILSNNEYRQIIDSIEDRYVIDYATLNRYAKRRNKEKIIKEYLRKLEGEKYDFRV